ncbi:TAP-like domain-containing protein [Trichoderma pleuroticola]
MLTNAFIITTYDIEVVAETSDARGKFDWASISPSKDLMYHDCFDGFKCARLIAPLDYKDDTDLQAVAIAMIKLPAVVSDDDPAFAGSLFANPGGPGGAGVGFMLRAGKSLRDVLDKSSRRHDEVVSFDPHSISNKLRGRGPLDGRGGANVPYIIAIKKAISLRCQDVEASGINGGQIMAYMYIGYSYGTVLGIYFAALFPGRVGRIALDGVVDVNDYSSGPGWMTNLVDTDEIANRFFSGCHEVGRKVCALSRNGTESDSSVKSRFYSWLSKLDEESISTISHVGDIIIIRSQDIRETLGAALYRPRTSFIALATALDDAVAGDTAAIVKILFQRHIPHLEDVCAINNTGPDSEAYLQEGTASVLCADGDSVSDYDIARWKRYINKQISASSVFGAYWSNIRMTCNSWNFRPNWIFKGTFTTPPVLHSASGNPISGYPAAPILFIPNRLDHVTPLSAVRTMAAQHPGAGLIITERLGHGGVGTSDSLCLHSYVADYFDLGVVPTGEATCIPDCCPWDIDCDTLGMEIVAWDNHGYGRGGLAF